MMKIRRSVARTLLAVPVLVAGSMMLAQSSLGQGNAPPAAAGAQDLSPIYEYADQITRLVQNGKIDELATLKIPDGGQKVALLRDWKSGYVTTLQKQEQERDKQYSDKVSKAQQYLKENRYDKAMESVVLAFRIAHDPEAFLKLDWVKDLTAKTAAKALDLEKQGSWIESLQLFSDLNTLYEVDTTYKADMQRLARRTRLIVVYTPKTFYEMRKAMLDREAAEEEKDNPTTKPAATTAAEIPDSFPRWQDQTEKITIDMARDAIERSVNDWVEKTSYETLLKGGVESLRLFLTTPELAKEFPALGDPAARKSFDEALDGALASQGKDGKGLTADDMERIMSGLIAASESSVKLPPEVILMEFTDGAMEKLDPFTAAIWPHEVDEFEKNTRGSFGGVGVQISLERTDVTPEEAALKKIDPSQQTKAVDIDQHATVDSKYHLVVVTPLEDTPAFKAGIEAGDVISSINGKTTNGISIDSAVHTITGEPGTPVTLGIKRGNEAEKEYTLKRDIIKVASVKGFQRDPSNMSRWDFMLDPETKVGYVRITGFQEDTAEELKNAVETLKSHGMRGLILDLRFNPGGLLNAAVDMCDMFLQDGVIVSTAGRSARARAQAWKAHSDSIIPANMPMVVLVNEYSASASEIFSGAMKDLHRALIVGHRSFGKGSVQNLLKIGNASRPDGNPVAMMKLTMAYYYLPNGESLHRKERAKNWGVDPDIAVDLTPDQLTTLLKHLRDNDIIPASAKKAAAATSPSGAEKDKDKDKDKNESPDTQLETALLMMRLQLVQSGA
jgi:carboxyl-terminal processing protease